MRMGWKLQLQPHIPRVPHAPYLPIGESFLFSFLSLSFKANNLLQILFYLFFFFFSRLSHFHFGMRISHEKSLIWCIYGQGRAFKFNHFSTKSILFSEKSALQYPASFSLSNQSYFFYFHAFLSHRSIRNLLLSKLKLSHGIFLIFFLFHPTDLFVFVFLCVFINNR